MASTCCPSTSGSTSTTSSAGAIASAFSGPSDDVNSDESGSTDDEETTEARDTTTSEASSNTAISLLDRLKAPKKSVLTRKRKIFTNPQREPGTRKKRPSCSSNPKSVMPAQRVREFPNECFTVSARTLFCEACRQEVAHF